MLAKALSKPTVLEFDWQPQQLPGNVWTLAAPLQQEWESPVSEILAEPLVTPGPGLGGGGFLVVVHQSK